jgi:hypothetical protein
MRRSGVALFECVLSVVVVMAMLACLLPMARRSRLADGQSDSINNVRTILAAEAAFRVDRNQIPMRGCAYNNGALNGWDTWSFGGKDCRSFWQAGFSGLFDESAYSRPLNPYLYPDLGLAVPAGYLNQNPWAPNWNFRPGHPGTQERDQLQLPVFRSPGDTTTHQPNWPQGTPGISTYDDVGSSYLLNLKWWELPGLPGDFTAHFNEGVRRIRDTAGPNYVWAHDSIADLVANGINAQGEFGGQNMSVLGFIDGRAEYREVVLNAMSGPGYTFDPSGTPLLPPARRLWIAHP